MDSAELNTITTADKEESTDAGHPPYAQDHDHITLWLERGLLATALMMPLKLSLTYLALLPTLLLWLFTRRTRAVLPWLRFEAEHFKLGVPLLTFFGCAALLSPFGLDPGESIVGILKAAALLLTIPLVFDIAKTTRIRRNTILALSIGATISALHTLLHAWLPETIPPLFHGEVSEAGQLCILVPFFLALLCSQKGVQFLPDVNLRDKYLSDKSQRSCWWWRCVAALLILALIANLKRGPWLGSCCGLLLFFYWYNRKLLAPVIIAVTGSALFIESIRDRLAASLTHFFISGGRSAIWDVGLELSMQFPLGVGYDNSGVLQKYDPSIPDNLTHLHNNLLNVLVETGWIGFSCFSLSVVLIARSLLRPDRFSASGVLSRALLCSLVSLQLAGLVEYNFGDSEVMLLFYLLVGWCAAHFGDTPAEFSQLNKAQ